MSEEAAEQIGEHTEATYDGYVLTLKQRLEDQRGQRVHLESFEVLQLLLFIDHQAALRALKWETLRRQAREVVSPEWQYCASYKVWRYMVGEAHIELAPRASYCDRGLWLATQTGVGNIDAADAFPRYFMDLTRAKLEMQEWLEHRMREYTDSEHKRWNNVANKIRDLRDALRRLGPELTDAEAGPLSVAYKSIQDRLAPSLDAER